MQRGQAAGFFGIAADQRNQFGLLHATEGRQDRCLCKGAQAKDGKTYRRQSVSSRGLRVKAAGCGLPCDPGRAGSRYS